MRIGLLLSLLTFGAVAVAQPPSGVMDFVRAAAEQLANNEPREFAANFDSSMPGFAALRDDVEALLAAHEVGSTIEVVSNEGDEQKQTVSLDWVLSVSDVGDRRQIVKCRVERQGKSWKFTSFEPIGFFKYDN